MNSTTVAERRNYANEKDAKGAMFKNLRLRYVWPDRISDQLFVRISLEVCILSICM